MSPSPLITVAIPCFNAERTIERCVTSALNQDWPNLEVIVSNNASEDGSGDVLSRISDSRLKVINQPINIGMNENFRFCLDQAQGELITFLNADDYLLDGSISERCKTLAKYDGVTIVASDARWEGTRSNVFDSPFDEHTDGVAVAGRSLADGQNYFHFSCALAPTALVRELGLSNNMFFDWVLWLRLMLRGSVVRVATPLTVLTDHANRQTKQRMKLKGIHCAELQGVLDEFAAIESLPASLMREKTKGRRLLLRRYLRSALEDYQQDHSRTQLDEERRAFLASNGTLIQRATINALLTFPAAFLYLWKVRARALRVFRA